MIKNLNVWLFTLSVLWLAVSCNPEANKKEDVLNPSATTQGDSIAIPIRDGLFVEKYSNGQKRMEGTMKNGKRDGVWKSYYENGALWSIGFYVNGVREGDGVVFYTNGNKYMEGLYKNNARAGKWTFYNEDGSVIKSVIFKE